LPSRKRHTGRVHGGPRNVFVDSGAWIALFSARDQYHVEAEALVREAIAQNVSMITTNLVLAEVHRLLLFRAGARAAVAAIGRIEQSRRVHIAFATAAHHQRAREWLDELANRPITYTDAASFAVMEALSCTVAFTFDHDFAIAGFARWSLGARGA
jgi:predicted nucleic acid-binding protein